MTLTLTLTITLTMMAQDPQSLEQMLTSLERPLRVLGGLCHAPVPDEVNELRRTIGELQAVMREVFFFIHCLYK